ncbi:MAG: ATP-binding cassette domain-containing protein, partial [Mycoplasmataceae bacterium]|nr:ATP-binding cassette domain-containing protein [Mycoplasmataceae bacterium]
MVKVRELKFKYQGAKKYALDGVDIDIPKFKYTVILGHNGSGKSTFSKLISGIYKPTDGEIYIDGIMIKKSSLRQIRKKVGI